ncbi:hypothetical protein VB779_15220 [Haloarculaceae archaeon H-GB11]|nr:hypothetical protein [Haloarculaceae archaeon H-GB11]
MSGFDGRNATLVARTELRRTRRRLDTGWKAILLTLLGGAFGLLYAAGFGAGAYFFVQKLAAGDLDPSEGLLIARGTLSGIALFVAFFGLQRTVKSIGRVDAPAGVLSATDHRTVAVGLLLAEFGRWLVVSAIPILCLAGGIGLGAGSAAAFALTVVVLLLVLAAGLVTGFVGGLVVKNLIARSWFVARHKTALGFLASFGFPAAYVFLMTADVAAEALLASVAYLPSSWYADLLLLGVPGAPGNTGYAAAAVAETLLAVPLGLASVGRLTGGLWFRDPVQPTNEKTVERGSRIPAGLEDRLPLATVRTAEKSWLRARRAPFTLQWALMPLFVLLYAGQQAFVFGIPPVLAATVGVALALSAASAFTLNPVGDEGRCCPSSSPRGYPAGSSSAGRCSRVRSPASRSPCWARSASGSPDRTHRSASRWQRSWRPSSPDAARRSRAASALRSRSSKRRRCRGVEKPSSPAGGAISTSR